ncbi:MAG: protein kinase domain-containing protein [Thermoguttaceae bacterium]
MSTALPDEKPVVSPDLAAVELDATAPPAAAAPTSPYVLSRKDLPRPPQQQGGPIPIGTELGHFIVERYIGGGGMGRVYLAHDTALDRKVAIKVLPKQRAHDRATVARFMNEARSAARLNHEHIAQVYFAHEYQGTPYIAFEYVEGTNVRDIVDAYGTFAVPQAVNYIIQIAHAIHHISLHGVVHRDVKPSNILITPNGRAKLIDMGLARLLDPSSSQHDLTASGVTLGTFDYISPEQARDPRSADIRSDIYSLGCTFFFMLTGRPPFPDGTVLQKLLQHQGDDPPSLHEFVPDIPPEIVHVVQKMMAKDPRQRYQTPQLLLQALVHAAELIGLHPSGPGQSVWVTRDSRPAPRWHVHLPWFVPATLLVIAAVAINIWDRQLPLRIPDVVPPSVLPTTPSVVTVPVSPSPTLPAEPLYTGVKTTLWSPQSEQNGIPNTSRAANIAITPNVGGGVILSPLQAKVALAPISGGGLITRSSSSQNTAGTMPTPNAVSSTITVDPKNFIVGAYSTLASALVAAENNSTIELCFSGPLRVEPFTIGDKNIRIVAGTVPATDGERTESDTTPRRYSPTLQFQGGDTSARAMIVIQGGSLTIEDVAIEMSISSSPSPWWSLIELLGRANFQANRCVMTLRNTMNRHTDVAFIRGISSAVSDAMSSRSDANGVATTPSTPPPVSTSDAPSASIQLQDSVVRGEATLLSWEVCRPVKLAANNCFIATEPVPFSLESSSRVCRRDEPIVTVDFQFVTLLTKGPLWQQVQTTSTAIPLTTRVQCSGSIFVFQQMPLFDFYTSLDANEAATFFQFVGGRLPNFFQGLESFGRVRTHAMGNPVYQISLDEWGRRSNIAPQLDGVAFESASFFEGSFNAISPRDLTLKQDAANPARQIDPETHRDAGVAISKLPPL